MRLGAFGSLHAYGIIGLLVAGAFAYSKYDRATNYAPVRAQVTSIDDRCYLQKKEGRTTSTSDVLDCAVAGLLAANHPQWKSYDVKHSITIGLRYVSPADGRTHEKARVYDRFPNARASLRSGDAVDVLASKRDGEKLLDL